MPGSCVWEKRFQSHAGSIEALDITVVQRGRVLGFNPTLVRLRRSRSHFPPSCLAPFQSHAGSIEAWAGRFHFEWLALVSIPRWFD